MDEYLEKVFEAAFKREFEQDENVVRSLPFFATALGLAVAIISQIATRMPPQNTPAGFAVLIILGLAGAAFLVILWSLFQVVRAREFLVPPNEELLLAWSGELVAFYKGKRQAGDKAEENAKSDVRRRMVEAYAAAAVENRKANAHKFKYRSLGFTALVVLITLATVAVGVIFVDKQVEKIHAERPEHQVDAQSQKQREGGSQRGLGTVLGSEDQTGRSERADGKSGGEVSIHPGSERLTNVGRTKSVAASSAPSAAANTSTHGDREEERRQPVRTPVTPAS